MTEEEIIKRLRVIFVNLVYAEEDCEYDDPEFLTGYIFDFVNFRCTFQYTMLHAAVIRNEFEGVKLLVDLGIDFDAKGGMELTALHYAVSYERDDIYKFLVEKGAATDIVSEFGTTACEMLEVNTLRKEPRSIDKAIEDLHRKGVTILGSVRVIRCNLDILIEEAIALVSNHTVWSGFIRDNPECLEAFPSEWLCGKAEREFIDMVGRYFEPIRVPH